jgi:hypothetical protein
MSSVFEEISKKLSETHKKILAEQRKNAIFSNLKIQTEAISVIKQKIAHYKKTGNKFKLQIYESKLEQKLGILGKLQKAVK